MNTDKTNSANDVLANMMDWKIIIIPKTKPE